MDNIWIYAYLALLLIYKLAENMAMRKTGTLARKTRWEWSMALIAVPYYLVMAGPLVEHLYLQWEGGYWHWILGGMWFVGAIFFRVRGHLDLQRGFSMAIEEVEQARLVQTGLYAYIRHPLYLGNLCLFVACPLFMATRYCWALTVLGAIGVLWRIQIEERFLRAHLEGYGAYMEKTSALVPWIY
jgi:protein-S-isoprenylcysteine O-methyltransferase Ste14